MADEPSVSSGWLPPRAPGAKPPPRFESSEREEPADAPAPAPKREPVRGWEPPSPRGGATQQQVADGPTIVQPPAVSNSLATVALVLGIVGLIVLLITLGIGTLISLPLSIAAWVCASKARGRIRRGETSEGVGNARAGWILGMVGVGLGLAALITWAALDAAGYTVDELRESIERELERQRNGES